MSFPQQSGFDVGSAYGVIRIDASSVDATIQQVNRSLGEGLQSMGSQIQSLGANLTVLTAPLLGFGVAGVRAASSFEDSLKSIEVRAGLTAEELALVEQKAIDIGRTSIYGPGQAAEAFLQLLTTGMSTAEAMETIDSVIAGAAASGADLAFVADGLTDIMASFRLGVEESADVMQTLIDATGASSADFPMLTAAMANVGTVAADLGFTVEETAAALAILHENGIKGAEAGTALKSTFNNLNRPTEEVQGLLNQLGVSTTDAQGNFKDLDTILKELNAAMSGLTEKERREAIFILGGSFGMVGLSALLAADGIDDMTDAMNGQADINDIANSRLETFSGAVSFLQGSVELLMIRALRPLMDNVLAPLVKWLADVVNKLEGWITANPALAETLVQILAVVATIGPVLVILGTAINAIGGSLVAFGPILSALLGPIGLVIAGIIALAIAWQTNFLGIRDTFAPIIGNIINGFGRLFTVIGFFISDLQNFGLAEAIRGIFGVGTDERAESSLEGLLVAFGFSREDAIEITNDVLNVFTAWFPTLHNLFISASRRLRDVFFDIRHVMIRLRSSFIFGMLGASSFKDILDSTGSVLIAFGGSVASFISNFMISMGVGIDTAYRFRDAIQNAFIGISRSIGFIREAFGILVYRDFRGFGSGLSEDNPLWNFFYNLHDRISGALTLIRNTLNSFFGSVSANLGEGRGLFQSIFAPLRFQIDGLIFRLTGVPLVFSHFVQSIENTFIRIRNAVAPALEQIGIFISNNIDTIIQWGIQLFNIATTLWSLTNPLGILRTALSLFGIDALAVFEDVMAGVTNFFATLNEGGSLGEALSAALFGDTETISAGVDNAIATLGTLATNVRDEVTPHIDTFRNTLSGVWENAQPHLNSLANWFISDIFPQVGGIIGSTGELFSAFGTTLSGLWELVRPHLEALGGWFLETGLPFVGSAISDVALPAIQTLIDALTRVWTDVSPFFLQLSDWFLNTILPSIIAFIDEVVMPSIQNFIDLLAGIWNAISPALESVYNFFIDHGLPFIMSQIESAGDIFTGFIDILAGIWTTLQPVFDVFRDGIVLVFNIISSTIQGVIDLINTFINTVNQAKSNAEGLANVGGQAASATGRALQQGRWGDVVGAWTGAIGHALGFAEGTNYITEDMLAMVHQGEAIVPAQMNPYNPQAESNGLSGGINIQQVIVNADTEAGGRAAARGFGDELGKIMMERDFS